MNAITGAHDPWLAKAAHLSAIFAQDAARNDREGGQPLAQLALL